MNIFNNPRPAFHTYLQIMTPIEEQAVNDGAVLPSTLVIPPGRYKVNGATYDMTTEGLYRFFDYSTLLTIQRIVYSADPVAIISSVMWLTTQSYADNSLTYPQMTERAKTDKLRIACGYATLWTKALLDAIGIPSRMVNGMTTETWNYVNDGHAMLEAFLNNKWVLFDFSFNTRFKKNGIYLNLIEVIENMSNYEIEQMTIDTSYDVTGLYYQGHSLASMFEPMISTSILYDLYARLLQTPLVYDGGKFYYFKNSPYEAQFQAWGYVKLNQAEWLNRFYP